MQLPHEQGGAPFPLLPPDGLQASGMFVLLCASLALSSLVLLLLLLVVVVVVVIVVLSLLVVSLLVVV